ncbi:unnamed protein product, partial [Polarella glacialis]
MTLTTSAGVAMDKRLKMAAMELPGTSVQFLALCGVTQPGDVVLVVGGSPELGSWDPAKGVLCTTDPERFPLWTSAPTFLGACSTDDKDKILEFKLVVARKDGPAADAQWECGENRRLWLPPADSSGSSKSPPAARRVVNACFEWGKPGVEAQLGQLSAKHRRRRRSTRHLVKSSDGILNIHVSRMPSSMLIDPLELQQQSAAKELELVQLERQRLQKKQQRMLTTVPLIPEERKIPEFADPSNIVVLQGFNWVSWDAGQGDWYGVLASKVPLLKEVGITDLWLPPPSKSATPQGYLPSHLFDLESSYGSEASLQSLLEQLHNHGMRGVADVVLSCPRAWEDEKQDSSPDAAAGVPGEGHTAEPRDTAEGWCVTLDKDISDTLDEHRHRERDELILQISHENQGVQRSITIWLRWLRMQVGFDAWRFDFGEGFSAAYAGLYCLKSKPAWAVGELWEDMEYGSGGLKYDQDQHRKAIVNWINSTGMACAAFDFTTKGILQEALRKCEYWRLRDSE